MFTGFNNLLKLARSDRQLNPKIAVYFITEQCNLNCAYCEDFGSHRNHQNQTPLPTDQVMKILQIIRSGVDALMLTGGEPLTHPDIDQILTGIKKNLKFKDLTLITNGFLLNQHSSVLACVDRLIVSLDSIEPLVLSKIIGMPPASAQVIVNNVVTTAALQNSRGKHMVLNAVLTPETLASAESLIEFCRQNKLLVSFSPQAVNNWPKYDLSVSPTYHAFIEKLLLLKHAGAPILGSEAYLKTLFTFQPYDCYPTLAPRIYSNGDLSYPCRPLEKGENGQGGRTINLLNSQSWSEAWEAAVNTHGQAPRTCHSCFQQCYAEPSLMQSLPFEMLYEWLRYAPNRSGNLSTYTPG